MNTKTSPYSYLGWHDILDWISKWWVQINLECEKVDSISPSPFVFSCCLIMFDQFLNNINRFVDAHDATSNQFEDFVNW
jgi:hypothetical protein